MTRILPRFPLLWALLTAMWLLLNQSAGFGHWLLGAMVALVATNLYALLQSRVHMRHRFRTLAEFVWIVLCDIVRSNIDVARIVMRGSWYRQTSAFLDVPLQLRSPSGLAVLACVITSNPGTVWASYDAETGVLTMHILDLIDEDEWMRIIKDRYERRLLEIFE